MKALEGRNTPFRRVRPSSRAPHVCGWPSVRNTPSTAGNSMTSSERPSPEPILKKEASPAVLGGLVEGNSRKRSESVSGVFPEFFRNFFRKVPAVLGVWPIQNVPDLCQCLRALWVMRSLEARSQLRIGAVSRTLRSCCTVKNQKCASDSRSLHDKEKIQTQTFKVARLQSELCTKDFLSYEISYEKCSEISPNF